MSNVEAEREHPESRVAVVTGASRGIGCGIAQHLKQQGIVVAGVSLHEAAPECDASMICDVGNAQQVEAAIAAIKERFGRIDILVNAAGTTAAHSLVDTPVDVWQRIVSTNLTGTFLMMREVLPVMVAGAATTGCRIVNVSSLAGKRGEPQCPAYAASKHGIIGLTRSASLQYAKAGITINAICPGVVLTDLLENGIKEWAASAGRPVELGRKVFRASSPQDRFFEVEEVAGLVGYLVSPAARGINGQAINLCGGAVFY